MGLIERAEAAMDGVTEGPWSVWWYDGPLGVASDADSVPDKEKLIVCSNVECLYTPLSYNNATFLAESRSLVPELVVALQEAREENERLRDTTAELELRSIVDRNEAATGLAKAEQLLMIATVAGGADPFEYNNRVVAWLSVYASEE